jgi:hypothetical protein
MVTDFFKEQMLFLKICQQTDLRTKPWRIFTSRCVLYLEY